jgi:hypothetical protein
MDTSAWQNFHLMAGGAAAALTGLIFVALSLHTKAIMAHPLFRDRAFASIQSLLALVFLSGAVLVPGQPPLALGLEVELVAIYFLIRSVYAVWLIRVAGAEARRRPGSRWLVEWIAWLLWLAALGTSGVCLMRDTPGGFYLLALSMVYMFGSNVWNAWVLIAEVSE